MRFNEGATLDPGQVQDSRGRGRGLAIGGGGLGIVGVLIALLMGASPADLLGGPSSSSVDSTKIQNECRTGADANRSDDCEVVGVVNSVQAYWTSAFRGYQEAPTRLFTGGVNTGCGGASSDVGPFYCPLDQTIYIDLSFFEVLKSRFGANGGPFARAYVIAHEYGHHVQNLDGTSDRVQRARGETGEQSPSVRLELQADCYAGVWAKNAVATGVIESLTEADIADGLSAAAAVGDDRIQSKAEGRVAPESWTHGSAAQRQRWFTNGYTTGRPAACNTFSGTV